MHNSLPLAEAPTLPKLHGSFVAETVFQDSRKQGRLRRRTTTNKFVVLTWDRRLYILYPGYERWWVTIEWNSRSRLVDEVVGEVRERIYAGRYAPGVPLRQEQLAAELDVSRTPLREALRKLETEGLVTVSPGRGVRVVSASPRSFAAAYQFREMLDGLAARLAAENGGEGLADALAERIEDQRRALEPWKPQEYTAANVEFHSTIFEASGNSYVVAQLHVVRVTAQVFTPVEILSPSRAESGIREHEGILEEIRSRNPDAAERAARAHIRRTIESLPSERDLPTESVIRQKQGGGE